MGVSSKGTRSSRAAQPDRAPSAADAAGRAAPAAKRAGERETSIRRGVEVLLSLATDEALAGSGLGVTRISAQLRAAGRDPYRLPFQLLGLASLSPSPA